MLENILNIVKKDLISSNETVFQLYEKIVELYNTFNHQIQDEYDKELFEKMFTKIPSEDIFQLGEILIPKRMITLSLKDILILKRKYNFPIKYFNQDGNIDNVILFDDRVEIYIKKKKKVIQHNKIDEIKFQVQLDVPEFKGHYLDLKNTLEEIFNNINEEEFRDALEKNKQEIKNYIEKEIKKKYNKVEKQELHTIPKITTNVLEDKNYGIIHLDDNDKEIIKLQKQEEISSLFHKNFQYSLEKKQVLYILLDISESTKQYSAYKMLDVATQQAVNFIKNRLKDKIDVYIIPFSTYVLFHKITSKLNNFILPDNLTNTHLALDFLLTAWNNNIYYFDQLIQNNTCINLFNNYEEDLYNLYSYDIERHSIRTYQNLFKNLYQKEKEKPILNVMLISDGMPSKMDETLMKLTLLKNKKVNYNQIVVAYDLNTEELIEEVFYRHISNGKIKSKSEYIEQLELMAETAKGNNYILWVCEQLSGAIISFFDVSLGKQFKNKY